MIEKIAGVHWEGSGKQGQGQMIAASAKRDCPLSKALAGVAEISLQATLDHSTA